MAVDQPLEMDPNQAHPHHAKVAMQRRRPARGHHRSERRGQDLQRGRTHSAESWGESSSFWGRLRWVADDMRSIRKPFLSRLEGGRTSMKPSAKAAERRGSRSPATPTPESGRHKRSCGSAANETCCVPPPQETSFAVLRARHGAGFVEKRRRRLHAISETTARLPALAGSASAAAMPSPCGRAKRPESGGSEGEPCQSARCPTPTDLSTGAACGAHTTRARREASRCPCPWTASQPCLTSSRPAGGDVRGGVRRRRDGKHHDENPARAQSNMEVARQHATTGRALLRSAMCV